MEIRWLKPEEYEAAFSLVDEHAGWMEKPGGLLLGQFDGEELVGIVGVVRPYVIEPLVMKPGHNPKSLILALDQRLDPSPYFCFVKDERFQKYIELQYAENVEGWEGKLYVRKRGCGGKASRTTAGQRGIAESGEQSESRVRPEASGQGEDSTARVSPDGAGDRPSNFYVESAGPVDFGRPKTGTLK